MNRTAPRPIARTVIAAIAVMTLPFAVGACGAGDAISSARNTGVCTAIGEGLDTVTQNIDLVKAGGELPAGTQESVTQALSALHTAASTATGQLASSLVGLETSANGLISALAGGSSKKVSAGVAAVQADVATIKAQCAAS